MNRSGHISKTCHVIAELASCACQSSCWMQTCSTLMEVNKDFLMREFANSATSDVSKLRKESGCVTLGKNSPKHVNEVEFLIHDREMFYFFKWSRCFYMRQNGWKYILNFDWKLRFFFRKCYSMDILQLLFAAATLSNHIRVKSLFSFFQFDFKLNSLDSPISSEEYFTTLPSKCGRGRFFSSKHRISSSPDDEESALLPSDHGVRNPRLASPCSFESADLPLSSSLHRRDCLSPPPPPLLPVGHHRAHSKAYGGHKHANYPYPE